jgi:hypothetical protein
MAGLGIWSTSLSIVQLGHTSLIASTYQAWLRTELLADLMEKRINDIGRNMWFRFARIMALTTRQWVES